MDRKLLYACPRAEIIELKVGCTLCIIYSMQFGNTPGAIDIDDDDVIEIEEDF